MFVTLFVQNCARVIDGMALTMHDVQRRFTFGYTVADARMDFWFCDKSQMVVSNPVNWITVSPEF